ncbi:RES family NAD+ phosphorylase [Cnuibacter sp. UC19_7]|uniref:RES family NAD+ phosphorylase n=1 Tax=Cnuibacter sp. UC19_7 TaxID=3350166 RepID=UPI00366E39DE
MIASGTALYRVHRNTREGTVFNPGVGSRTRFAFFGDPPVPSLYAADTEIAALAETLLHDIPVTGGLLPLDSYAPYVLSLIRPRRPLRLASFLGTGLRRLRVGASDLTTTEASEYPRTVRWAEAAHAAGFDGVAYMSRQMNTSRAVALFGDRVTSSDLEVDPGYGRAFAIPSGGRDWLIDVCAPMHVDVLLA